MTADEARAVLAAADCICSEQEVEAAVERVAADVTRVLAERDPLALVVMSGAVVFAGQLLTRLAFPLDLDYLHVTRYANTTRGGTLEWKTLPQQPVAGRTVLVIDDVLDEGDTLAEIRRRLLADGAAAVYSAVFAEKDLGKPKPVAADFVGVKLPNRYMFGFGMDVRGAWRNLPAIYALKEE
ncbi:MAG TPA: hypoxanthine-guanine phosphoribosyltransferase [Burkholderiales bacterium]|nr:hypoxanthine-guanine phosphoribosyltransferase [Burkholderiales bacterium]